MSMRSRVLAIVLALGGVVPMLPAGAEVTQPPVKGPAPGFLPGTVTIVTPTLSSNAPGAILTTSTLSSNGPGGVVSTAPLSSNGPQRSFPAPIKVPHP